MEVLGPPVATVLRLRIFRMDRDYAETRDQRLFAPTQTAEVEDGNDAD